MYAGEEYKISSLKPGMENVSVKVRVIEATQPRVVQTRRGPRTISDAVVGDETGRIRLTLWGSRAGELQAGDAVLIEGAWTTSYRGRVVLNAGNKSSIRKIGEDEVPQEEDIPDKYPSAPQESQYQKRNQGWQRRRGRRQY